MFLHGDCGRHQINQTHRRYRVLGPESLSEVLLGPVIGSACDT